MTSGWAMHATRGLERMYAVRGREGGREGEEWRGRVLAQEVISTLIFSYFSYQI